MDKDKEEFQHDWYAILGCDVGSPLEVIQKAARKLAIKYHPDKTSDPTAPEKFLLIQKAKDILSDETKKKVIDEYYATVKKREEYEVQRNKTMDERRKRFRDSLEQRVEEEKSARKRRTEESHEDILMHELAKNSKVLSALRKQNEPILEQAREEARRRQEKKNEDFVAYSRQLASETGVEGSGQCSIKVKWRKSLGDTITKEQLHLLFGTFGTIEDIDISKDKKSTAVVYFSQGRAARAAIDAFATNEDFRVSFQHSTQDSTLASDPRTVFTNNASINEMLQEEVSKAREATARETVLNPFRAPTTLFETNTSSAAASTTATNLEASAPSGVSLATKEADVLKRLMQAAAEKKLKQQQQAVDASVVSGSST